MQLSSKLLAILATIKSKRMEEFTVMPAANKMLLQCWWSMKTMADKVATKHKKCRCRKTFNNWWKKILRGIRSSKITKVRNPSPEFKAPKETMASPNQLTRRTTCEPLRQEELKLSFKGHLSKFYHNSYRINHRRRKWLLRVKSNSNSSGVSSQSHNSTTKSPALNRVRKTLSFLIRW